MHCCLVLAWCQVRKMRISRFVRILDLSEAVAAVNHFSVGGARGG
jgi:hypothetical protein